jgi:nucleotide-binding universal stress UspA family protein
MARTILVPLDGSPLAERTLPYAEAIARPCGGRLALVRAVPYLARPAGEQSFPTLAAARNAAADEARAYLEGVGVKLAERGLDTQIAVPYEEEADGIIAEAQRAGADLIAMATHGRGGLGRWIYGSVAQEVIARAKLPTLLVRAWLPEGGAALLADAPRILVPLDGTATNEGVLPVAEGLAADLGGTIVLVRAVARPDLALAPDALAGPLLREELAEEQAKAERYLRGVATRLAEGGRAVETVVRVGRPGLDMAATGIESVGRECGAALVVMTSHRRAGLERLLLGSVADATIRHGTLPVVPVRP